MSGAQLDIWGGRHRRQPAGIRSGDADGHPALRTERGFLADAVGLKCGRQALLPIWMFTEDGRPYGR